MNARTVSAFAGLFLLSLGVFFTGMWSVHKNWLPWRTTEDARKLWQSWRATGKFLRDGTYVKRQADAADAFYTVYDAAAVAPGYLVVNRFHPTEQRFVTDLIDTTGKIIHTWRVDFSQILDKNAPVESTHAATALPDGSLLVNFDGAPALARIDPCGNPIWARTDGVYHHTIERANDGYWVWQSGSWDGGQDQKLVRFDPENGRVLETIDLAMDVITKSARNSTALTIPEGFVFNLSAPEGMGVDIFHTNDIEELSAAMAPAFPQFKAGDLLISLRNINGVMVIDRKSRDVLWAQYGPWRNQHDPDFQPDGTITVFSNNNDRNRSTIIQIDPRTNISQDMFWGTDANFSSYIMGRQQRLPNGNWLITSAMEGRVIEVSAQGKMVREISNVIDGNYNSIITYAEYLPEGYFTSLPVCKK